MYRGAGGNNGGEGSFFLGLVMLINAGMMQLAVVHRGYVPCIACFVDASLHCSMQYVSLHHLCHTNAKLSALVL